MIDALFPKTKQKILALVFLHPDRRFYLGEIERLLKTSKGTLSRELKLLVKAGILTSEKKGKQAFYSVNTNNPIYPELRSIVYKTFGIADMLKKVLKPLKAKIKAAFIYGSVASGEESARSDIDVMLIGSITFMKISIVLDKAEKTLGREINPTVYPVKEFKEKHKQGNHFIKTVIKSEKIFITGSEDDLKAMVK